MCKRKPKEEVQKAILSEYQEDLKNYLVQTKFSQSRTTSENLMI